MKKTMRGYSWICLVAGLVWLACGQMEAGAWWREPPITDVPCTNCLGEVGSATQKTCAKGETPCDCDDEGSPPGKPRLTLKNTGEVIIRDTPVAFYPPKGGALEFKMLYNSHGGIDYLNLENGGGGWHSILGDQWAHSFEWKLEKSSSDYMLVIPGNRHVHFTNYGDDAWTAYSGQIGHPFRDQIGHPIRDSVGHLIGA